MIHTDLVGFADLMRHVGHELLCVSYGGREAPHTAALECHTCGEVLLQYEAGPDDQVLPVCDWCHGVVLPGQAGAVPCGVSIHAECERHHDHCAACAAHRPSVADHLQSYELEQAAQAAGPGQLALF